MINGFDIVDVLYFLAENKQLYEGFSPSVCLSACLSVCPFVVLLSVRLFVTPFHVVNITVSLLLQGHPSLFEVTRHFKVTQDQYIFNFDLN